MMAGLGSLIGAGGSLVAGAIGSSNDTKNRRNARARGQLTLDNLLQTQEGFAGQEEGYLQQSLQSLLGGYQDALNTSSGIAQGSRRRVLDREVAQRGQINQSMVDRGLYNTTLGANLERGVRSDTDRALLDIDSQLAQIQSNILQNGARAGAQGYAQLADFYRNRSRDTTAIEGDRFSLLSGIIPQGGSSFDFGGLGKTLDSLFGGDSLAPGTTAARRLSGAGGSPPGLDLPG